MLMKNSGQILIIYIFIKVLILHRLLVLKFLCFIFKMVDHEILFYINRKRV